MPECNSMSRITAQTWPMSSTGATAFTPRPARPAFWPFSRTSGLARVWSWRSGADAIVGIGRALNYLADAAAIRRGLVALADALLPGGLLAVDLCDLEWGTARRGAVAQGRVGDDWAIVTRFSQPAPDRFDRDLTTFVRGADGSYRREDEHHGNVLIDTSLVPALLREHGVRATIGGSFNDDAHPLPVGLRSIVGHR
jgi:hypothetical protein